MTSIQFNCDGRMADIGKAGEQFDHKKGEKLDVSPQCAEAAVGYKMAVYASDLAPKPGPKKADKPGPKEKSEKNPAKKDKEASES